MLQIQNNLALLTMPVELRLFTLKNCSKPSPYNRTTSGSFYNCEGKTWDYTPDGSIRVSDHWNFYSRGSYHCKTDIEDSKIVGKWVVAKYNATKALYEVICADEKDEEAIQKRYKRQADKKEAIDYDSIRHRRICKASEIKRAKEKAIRAKKIKDGNLWAEVNVNVWSGSGRRVRFAGTETIVGQITWESKTGSSFCVRPVGGYSREIRKYNSYKELNRKPYTRKASKKIAA